MRALACDSLSHGVFKHLAAGHCGHDKSRIHVNIKFAHRCVTHIEVQFHVHNQVILAHVDHLPRQNVERRHDVVEREFHLVRRGGIGIVEGLA